MENEEAFRLQEKAWRKKKREEGRGKAKGKNRYPLRKVMERDIVMDWIAGRPVCGNRLDSGHVVKPAKDFYGEIHSERQRCRACFEEFEW